MALVLDEDQTLIKDTAREFCTSRTPVSQLRELRDNRDPLGYSAQIWREMAELGWAGIILPEELGGTGFGYQALGAILEETGRTLTASPLLATVMIGGSALMLGGTRAQQEGYVPRIAAGELTLALALEEGPHHAPWNIETDARTEGDGWVLNGRKVFVIDGHSADALIVVARTSGQPGDRNGLSLFLIPGDAEGVTRTRTFMADSRNAAIVELAGVRAGRDALLGEVDQGAEVLEATLDRARIGLAAEMLGNADAAFEMTLAYIRERKQFGQPVGSFQGLQHRAADMFCEIELSRSAVRDALTALDEGREDIARAASLAKAKVGETLHGVAAEGIQMHGGIGMTDEHDIGFYLKRARVAEQAFGSSAFHRDRYATLAGY